MPCKTVTVPRAVGFERQVSTPSLVGSRPGATEPTTFDDPSSGEDDNGWKHGACCIKPDNETVLSGGPWQSSH